MRTLFLVALVATVTACSSSGAGRSDSPNSPVTSNDAAVSAEAPAPTSAAETTASSPVPSTESSVKWGWNPSPPSVRRYPASVLDLEIWCDIIKVGNSELDLPDRPTDQNSATFSVDGGEGIAIPARPAADTIYTGRLKDPLPLRDLVLRMRGASTLTVEAGPGLPTFSMEIGGNEEALGQLIAACGW